VSDLLQLAALVGQLKATLKSVRGKRSLQTATPNAKFCDAYWRLADPMPALFHFLAESGKSL
jgi:hypothetical protein